MTEQQNTGTGAEYPVRALVRQVAEDLAPEELRVLAALDGISDAEAVRRLAASPGRDERLGFGVGEAVALISAVAWIGLDEAVRQIVAGTLKKAVRPALRWWRLPRRRQTVSSVIVPVLSAEQLKLVDRCVLDAAQTAGLPPEQGSRIADNVVRRLVIGPGPAQQAALPDAHD